MSAAPQKRGECEDQRMAPAQISWQFRALRESAEVACAVWTELDLEGCPF